MPQDEEYKEAKRARVLRAQQMADWESRNRNFYGDEKGESGAAVSEEVGRAADDIARINARRAMTRGTRPRLVKRRGRR
jgi:hypothetical protein